MAQPIVIAGSTRFCIRYSTDDLLNSIAPFIEKVSQDVAKTADLEESVLKAAESFPDSASYFLMAPGEINQTFGLHQQYLFADYRVRALIVSTPHLLYKIELSEGREDLPQLKTLLELCGAGTHSKATIRSQLSDDGKVLFDSLLEIGSIVEEKRTLPNFAPGGIPGVYRLQHASLLYRTETTGILVDPHLHSTYRPAGIVSDVYKDVIGEKVDAILISHFHEDHFFLSTLLMFDKDIPIVVPKVPRSTIICTDMVNLLHSFGFRNVIAVDWYSDALRFGDAEVHVLPFFGEQPLRFEAAKDPALRNWGNTYVIRTKHYTSWFLIDSGIDALGSMNEVADYVRRKIGRVDVLLSNLRRFCICSPRYINGGLNWLALSPNQIRNFKSMSQHCITLGPGGVAEVCKTVGARYYLPYAHWWGELGRIAETGLDTPGQHEAALIDELSDWIQKLGANTKIVRWHIGDGFVARPEGGFRHTPIGQRSPLLS